jgi:hypothetical protein
LGGETLVPAFQSHQVQQFANALINVRFGTFSNSHSEGNVLKYGHMPEQSVMLEDEPDFSFLGSLMRDVQVLIADETIISRFQAGDDSQQRGLAGTGRPQQCDQFAPTDFKVDMVQSYEVRELLADIYDANTHEMRLLSF